MKSPEPDNAIEVRNLTKTFGSVVAVDGLSFAVPRGSVAGFIGPNGSGKSTTMRILATLERQDQGTAKLLDMDVRLRANLKQVRQAVGFMPDHFGLYPDMTAGEFLTLFAAAYHIPVSRRRDLVQEILAIVDLSIKEDALIRGLSRGMQQKLSLGRCLIHDPAVLILDEPASGLDPRARIELLECLKELQRLGKTILISSHILTELQALCDMLVIIESGGLAYAGTLEAAAEYATRDGRYLELVIDGDVDEAVAKLGKIAGVIETRRKGAALYAAYDSSVESADLIHACALAGVRIAEARRGLADLETVFMRLTAATDPEHGSPDET